MKPTSSAAPRANAIEPKTKQDKLAMKFPGLAIANDPKAQTKFDEDSKEKILDPGESKKRKKDKDSSVNADVKDFKSDHKPAKKELEANVIDDAMAALEALAPSQAG